MVTGQILTLFSWSILASENFVRILFVFGLFFVSRFSVFFVAPEFGGAISGLKQRFCGPSWPFSESARKTVHNGGVKSVLRRVWASFQEVRQKVLEFCQKPVSYKIFRVRQKKFLTNQGFDKAHLRSLKAGRPVGRSLARWVGQG